KAGSNLHKAVVVKEMVDQLPEDQREEVGRKALLALGLDIDGGGMPGGSIIPDFVSDAVGAVGGTAVHAASRAWDQATEKTGVQWTVKPGLGAAEAAGRITTQAYRFGVEIAASSPEELSFSGVIDEITESWAEAGRGQEYVDPM